MRFDVVLEVQHSCTLTSFRNVCQAPGMPGMNRLFLLLRAAMHDCNDNGTKNNVGGTNWKWRFIPGIPGANPSGAANGNVPFTE